MQIVIHTLIDITNTNARKGDDKLAYSQQQNYMTLLNTIGLRSNFEIVTPVSMSSVSTTKDFGSLYKGKHNVRTMELCFDSQGTDSINILELDLNLVPFISGLTETCEHGANVFRTNDSKNSNIIFKVVDNTIL